MLVPITLSAAEFGSLRALRDQIRDQAFLAGWVIISIVKRILCPLLFVLLAYGVTVRSQQQETKPSPTDDVDKPRQLSLVTRAVNGALYTTEQAPIQVVFRNDSKNTIRVLDAFRDPGETRVFFSVTLRDVYGVPIFTSGGGKADFAGKSLKYIELGKGEEYVVNINLKEYLPSRVRLEQGGYSVSVVYQNQYGEDCFRGTLESDLLALSLVKGTSRGTDEHTDWIAKSLKEIETIKVGMTRADLLRVFEEEGGISSRTSQRYGYRNCPYVKVDVVFEPVDKPNDSLSPNTEDKIIKISKPFLELPIMD
jgi:hypothetical protein